MTDRDYEVIANIIRDRTTVGADGNAVILPHRLIWGLCDEFCNMDKSFDGMAFAARCFGIK